MSTESAFVARAIPVLHSDRAQAIEEAASTRGFAAGYAAGARAAQEGAERLRASLEEEHARRSAEQVESTRRTVALLRDATRALVERTVPVVATAQEATLRGALSLAEAIVGLELADHERAAHAALARITSSAEPAVVEVRMHPDDVRLLVETGVSEPVLVPDATLRRGDAVADLEHGFLDARVGSAVERARAELAALVESDRPGASPDEQRIGA